MGRLSREGEEAGSQGVGNMTRGAQVAVADQEDDVEERISEEQTAKTHKGGEKIER
jgi:hypothetical protein